MQGEATDGVGREPAPAGPRLSPSGRKLVRDKYEVAAVPQCRGQAASRPRGENDIVFTGAAWVYFPENLGLRPLLREGVLLRCDHRQPRQKLMQIGAASLAGDNK